MREAANNYELPRSIEQFLAAVSKLYAQDEKHQLQEIIVNAQVRVHEEWSSDNWNGGTYGHALYLVVPEAIFLNAVKHKAEIQDQIKEDLNKVHNVQNEFIEEVFLEMEPPQDEEWRRASGLLLVGKRVVTPDIGKRIWGESGFRLFLSHKSEFKKETAALKEALAHFGISGFVAHADIKPTKEWQDEIENALTSMEGFVALLTGDFHDSDWTDQEVGFAVSRGVPIIAVRLGKDPYGFIGKFQGLSCDWEHTAFEILKLLIKCPSMLESFVFSIERIRSFDRANIFAEMLPSIDQLLEGQVEQLIVAFNSNAQVRESYGFNGKNPAHFGLGLPYHLTRLTGRKYELNSRDRIQLVP